MNNHGDSTIQASDSEAATASEPPQRCAREFVVFVAREDGDWSAFDRCEEAIHDAATALAQHDCCGDVYPREATVVLGSDALVQRLNLTYRGKDAPTNVLSFPFRAPPGEHAEGASYLGDVILAAETVRREADERGIAVVHHLQHLVVHGLLHLMGYDHESEPDAQRMERLETEVLAALGIADPYGAA
jgi:probable rRNA maturation factor